MKTNLCVLVEPRLQAVNILLHTLAVFLSATICGQQPVPAKTGNLRDPPVNKNSMWRSMGENKCRVSESCFLYSIVKWCIKEKKSDRLMYTQRGAIYAHFFIFIF